MLRKQELDKFIKKIFMFNYNNNVVGINKKQINKTIISNI